MSDIRYANDVFFIRISKRVYVYSLKKDKFFVQRKVRIKRVYMF